MTDPFGYSMGELAAPDIITAVQDLLALLTTKRVDPESTEFTIMHGLISAAIQVSQKLAAKTEQIIRSRSPSPRCPRFLRGVDHASPVNKVRGDVTEQQFAEIRARCICTHINWQNSLAAAMEIERVLQAASEIEHGIWMLCDVQYNHIVDLFANSHQIYRFGGTVCIK